MAVRLAITRLIQWLSFVERLSCRVNFGVNFISVVINLMIVRSATESPNEIFSTSSEVFGTQLTKSSDKHCRYTRIAIMDTAPRLPNSTVAMLVESLTAYSVGNTPNRVGTLTVFGSGSQLVGAIDLGDQENPQDVSKNDAQQMIEVASGLVQSATSFDGLMKYIKVSYKDRELLVIPGNSTMLQQ